MKYVALTLVAVLAMASVSMAALTINVSDPVDLDDPNNVLEAYTVNVKGANMFLFVQIDGLVHQMNRSTNASLWRNSLDANDDSGLAKLYDTHFLFNSTDVVLAVAGGTETNDQSNPGGLPLPFPNDDVSNVNRAGMGTFNMGLAEWGSALIDMEVGCDLIQIVLPKGLEVGVTLRGQADGGQGPMDFSVVVGGPGTVIPEPGTIMLLLTGVLCLVGIRRR